jgi:hypothetical protein
MKRWLGFLVVPIVLASSGCEDDPIGVVEPDIAVLRLTIGTQIVEITEATGAATNLPIRIPLGATTITATPFRADGTPDPHVNARDFVLSVTPANATLVTFTRGTTLNGTLNGLVRGSTTVTIEITHGDHADFGPHSVAITIQ